jgi:iron(II)-dependent oxidoreductase
VHRVQITKGFWLGKCTVTNAQYNQYCQAVGADIPQGTYQGDNYPVGAVTWDQAQAYCQHYGLSLPTEAQWEYAARGPEGRRWPWGNTWDPKKCNASTDQGPDGHIMPVGSFPAGASWCGALDMAGNMWQWCQDWYDSKYYANSPAQDPPGPDTGTERVRRGGSWVADPDTCRSAARDHLDPTNPGSGFRCVRTP